VDSYLRRTDLAPRWCDLREALVYPAAPPTQAETAASSVESSATRRSGTGTYVIQPDYFPIDPVLRELFLGNVEPFYERRLEDGTFVFAVYPLDAERLSARLALTRDNPVGWSTATAFPEGLPDDWAALEGPVDFGGKVELLGYELLNGEQVAPGDGVTVLTYWQAIEPGPGDGITFLHLLSPEGAVVAGYDGFGAPPNRWIAGDVVVQVHRFALPGDLPPGAYPVELGWYGRDTGARWLASLPAQGQTDRLLLQPLQIASAGE
jgi:hypothetical protein